MNSGVLQALESSFGGDQLSASRLCGDGPELPLVTPNSREGILEALSVARRGGWSIVVTGLGSKLGWTRTARRADFLLSTRRHAGVVAYEPGDGTLTARAGTTLAELASHVASGGHGLTPDVPRPERATLGGVIGAAQSGSDRLRYGPLRDHVLGLEFALSDGTLAKCGGRLVKNVTGYDLQRLFCGSHGTLGVILEASLRLFPLPEEECSITAVASDNAQMLQLAGKVLAADARPISFSVARLDPPHAHAQWMFAVRLGGRREVVVAERAILSSIFPGALVQHGSEARSDAGALRDRGFGASDGPMLRVEIRPAQFAFALGVLDEWLRAPGASSEFRPRVWCEPGLGQIDVALLPRADLGDQAVKALAQLRSALAVKGGRVRLFNGPREFVHESHGAAPAGAQLMQSIRDRLDPARVLATGRFPEFP